MGAADADPHDGDLDSHLLCCGVNPRRPSVRVSASKMVRWCSLAFTTSAIPLSWPAGCRSETLRPPLSVEFAFVGGVELSDFLIGACS
jgi:hypothetical protein